jgi:hypothetical protein
VMSFTSSAAAICARCGARVTHPQEEPHQPPPAEKVPVSGALSGLYFGLIALSLMLIVGMMLCLTGWGIVFGLPIVVLAIFAPLVGPSSAGEWARTSVQIRRQGAPPPR